MGQAALRQKQSSGTPPLNDSSTFKPVILGFGELSSRPFQRKADHFVNYQAGSSADDNYGVSGTETHSKI